MKDVRRKALLELLPFLFKEFITSSRLVMFFIFAQLVQALFTHIRIFLKTETFFSVLTSRPCTRTGKRPFWALKTMLSKAVLEWRFLKTPASHLRVDGRKQRFSKAIIHVLASHMLLKHAMTFPQFQLFHVDMRKLFKYATCDAYFFENEEKNIRFWHTQISADTSEQSYN